MKLCFFFQRWCEGFQHRFQWNDVHSCVCGWPFSEKFMHNFWYTHNNCLRLHKPKSPIQQRSIYRISGSEIFPLFYDHIYLNFICFAAFILFYEFPLWAFFGRFEVPETQEEWTKCWMFCVKCPTEKNEPEHKKILIISWITESILYVYCIYYMNKTNFYVFI